MIVFVFSVFNPPPLLFSKVHSERVQASPVGAGAYAALKPSSTPPTRRAERPPNGSWRRDTPMTPRCLDAAKVEMRERDAAAQAVRAKAATLVRESAATASFPT